MQRAYVLCVVLRLSYPDIATGAGPRRRLLPRASTSPVREKVGHFAAAHPTPISNRSFPFVRRDPTALFDCDPILLLFTYK